MAHDAFKHGVSDGFIHHANDGTLGTEIDRAGEGRIAKLRDGSGIRNRIDALIDQQRIVGTIQSANQAQR